MTHFKTAIWILLPILLLSGTDPFFGRSRRNRGQTVVAQKYHLESYTAEEGLPLSQVWDALQNWRGEIWLALYSRGIARFDGHIFTRIGHEDELSEQPTQSQTIYEDRTGVLWFDTI